MKKLQLLLVILIPFYFQAQIVNIPDANFKARLLQASPNISIASTETPDQNGAVNSYNAIDTNGDGEIQVSEAQLIKYLYLSPSFGNITSLEGINSFTNLQSLFYSYSQTSLDVSGLTNLKYLGCQYGNLQNLNVTGLINLRKLYCRSNQLSSLNISGLTSLEYLDCSYNQLTSLVVNNLTNLTELDCINNQLTSLDVSGLTSLIRLYCSNNQLSNLNVSGLTSLIGLSCLNNQLSNLNVSGLTNLGNFNCSNNQLSNLNVSGLTSLGTLDCSFNQLTTLDLNSLTSISSLNCENNQLPNLDISQLTSLAFLECQNNQLTNLDMNQLTSLEYLDCSNNQLISLFLKSLADDWADVIFNNNPNLIYICAKETDFPFIQNIIDEYGYSATCQLNSYCDFTPGGVFYTINGTNKFDGNNNGCDASDSICSNLKFEINNGTVTGSLTANASGNYYIPVQAGTYTITPQLENPSYFTSSPISATVTFPATASPFTENFCFTPNGTHHDLGVVIIPLIPAIPGFNATYKIILKNKGTSPETTTLSFNYNDAILDYVSSSLTPTSQATGSLSWNIGTINPLQSIEFTVTLNVNSPTETPAVNDGDVLNYSAVFNGLNSDETPIDNTFSLNQTVVNSFDPNDKTCLEGNTINPSMIGEYVHYKIRFENTGTFPAQNIVVKDMIDTATFDISTLQMTDASHNCVTRISDPNKVEFIFENINLPFDDATNDGYVVFKIKTKNTLVVGNTISNLANIYFDYNFPIVTNTATSTFQVLQNDSFVFDTYFSIYPNPAQDVLNLNVKQDVTIYSLSIYSILGQQVQTITNPEKTIDVSGLPSGNYLIKIVTNKGISNSKFIKE
ncbi:MAG: leucine-rich repeat domain-containing protein [Bacteroidota bacterium]